MPRYTLRRRKAIAGSCRCCARVVRAHEIHLAAYSELGERVAVCDLDADGQPEELHLVDTPPADRA